TLVFSIADAAVLRPLPYAEPDQLVWVSQGVSAGKTEYALAPDFAAWRSQVRTFAQATAFSERFRNFAGKGEPVRILTAEVTHEFLSTLGAQPTLGRDFLTEEDRPGGARVALLAYDFCARRFGAVQSCVGETLKLDGVPFEVVGVLPEHFRFPQPLDVDVLTPLALGPEQEERVASAEVGVRQVKVIARLRPGATVEQARAELNAVQNGVVQSYPQLQDGRGVSVRTLHEHLTEGIKGAALFPRWRSGCCGRSAA
ncbi:MAG TPA: ABC transporter permease, partial [Pyrinomonadaceae bacterium]